MVDLTPAAIGPFCVPPVNLKDMVGTREQNVNMVTCGGQATIPMVAAVSRVQPVEYGEIIATVSSQVGRSGDAQEHRRVHAHDGQGRGSRRGRGRGKAIIIINPAEPPLIMRDTDALPDRDEPEGREIIESVEQMIAEVQKYVPGYTLKNGPVFDGNRVSFFMEVEGLGDFLPKYAGNLDIMTAAGLRTAELFAEDQWPSTRSGEDRR